MANTFDIVPKELRLIIFEHVFMSPSGLITLSRIPRDLDSTDSKYKIFAHHWASREIIHLSILRTCKKFYSDCKDLLWKHNTLNLGPSVLKISPMSLIYLYERISNNVHSLQLEIGLLDCAENVVMAARLEYFLHIFGSWTYLKSLTLVVRDGWLELCKVMRDFVAILHGRDRNGTPLARYLELFKNAGREGGCLGHLKRKMIFNVGPFAEVEDWFEHGELQQLETSWPEEMFQRLASFGGDLILNGDIYYSGGAQKERLFCALWDPMKPHQQTILLAIEYALQKLEVIYGTATKRKRQEIRDHWLGTTVLSVSKEEMEKIRLDIEEWFAKGPKQLVHLTKNLIKEKLIVIET
jgi:hypothetical protein